MTKERQLPKRDDWANTVTGLGGPVDKNQYAFFQNLPWLQEAELDNLYENNALAARIVDRLPDDAIRAGFTLTGKDKDFDFSSLNSDLENHKVLPTCAHAWKQARLYAGSLIVFALNDGRKYDEPVDWDNLTGMSGMRIIPSVRAQPLRQGTGLGSDSYLRPEFYMVTTNGKQKKIHWSRCLRFEGVPELGDHRKVYKNGWGISALQRVYRELSNLGQVEGYSANLMHELSVISWTIEGLYEKMCGGDGQKEAIQQMVEQTKALMDQLHVLLLDKNDSVNELKRDVSGVDKLLEKFVDALVRATDMPRLILLGEQPGGLNNSADGETRGWYDFVASKRSQYLNDKINYFLRIFFKIRENKGLPIPKDWTIEWKPLWQPSEGEQSETLLKQMQAYQIGIQLGIFTAEDIKKKLISEGKIEGSLDPLPVTPPPSEAPSLEKDEESISPAAQPSSDPVPPDLMATKEAASLLGVPTLTVNNLCRKGELPYWQFGSRVQVSMSDLLAHGKRGDSRKYFDCKPRRDAKSLGIFIRVPQTLIDENELPPINHEGEPSPYHCTLLIMESVHGEMEDFIATVKTTLQGIGSINAKITGTEKIIPSGLPVATLDFEKDLTIFRTILINVLRAKGWDVSEKYPEWKPHMTLSYAPINSDDIPKVKGSFEINEFEIWGYGDPVKVKL